jgi:hypothetical protein
MIYKFPKINPVLIGSLIVISIIVLVTFVLIVRGQSNTLTTNTKTNLSID